jgi:hypothetical protein
MEKRYLHRRRELAFFSKRIKLKPFPCFIPICTQYQDDNTDDKCDIMPPVGAIYYVYDPKTDENNTGNHGDYI